MNKFKFTVLSCIATALIFTACSDDKNEPDNPNKGNGIELPEVEENGKYRLSYPMEYTLVSTGETTYGNYIWPAFDKLIYTTYPFGHIVSTWGNEDIALIIKRTDGKPLKLEHINYYSTYNVIAPHERGDGLFVLYQDDRENGGVEQWLDIDISVGDEYKTDYYSVRQIDEYSAQISIKAIQKNEETKTRVLEVRSAGDFVPTKITSIDGKTEYKLSEKVLECVPRYCMITLGAYVVGPLNNQSPYSENVLMKNISGSIVSQLKK